MASGTLHVGRTYQFQPTGGVLKVDGAARDLTGATVYAMFKKPSGTIVEEAVEIITAATGIIRYRNPTSFFVLADVGNWRRNWRLVQGTTDVILERWIPFVLEA